MASFAVRLDSVVDRAGARADGVPVLVRLHPAAILRA
jgi:hypothetical protein